MDACRGLLDGGVPEQRLVLDQRERRRAVQGVTLRVGGLVAGLAKFTAKLGGQRHDVWVELVRCPAKRVRGTDAVRCSARVPV